MLTVIRVNYNLAKTAERMKTFGVLGRSQAIVRHLFREPLVAPAVHALLSSANTVPNVSTSAVIVAIPSVTKQ